MQRLHHSESLRTFTLAEMEAMEDDSPNRKDDHNHNYCPSGGGKVRTYVRSQLSDAAAAVKQPVCLPVSAEEQVARRGKAWSGTSGGTKFMDSDSSSESSEVSELDGSAPSGSSVEGKFTLDTTSKFRKFMCFGFKSELSASARPKCPA